METAADAGGLEFTGQDTVHICFVNDSLEYKFSYNRLYNCLFAGCCLNGMIFAKNAVVRLKGTVKGQYTIGCNSTTTSTDKGTVWLDDNIAYNQDPRQYPNSTDMLGICAENNVWITKNSVNNTSINIHASIYCEKVGFAAQDATTRPVSGNINLFGGIIHKTRGTVELVVQAEVL